VSAVPSGAVPSSNPSFGPVAGVVDGCSGEAFLLRFSGCGAMAKGRTPVSERLLLLLLKNSKCFQLFSFGESH
jgi:hypothetical protein